LLPRTESRAQRAPSAPPVAVVAVRDPVATRRLPSRRHARGKTGKQGVGRTPKSGITVGIYGEASRSRTDDDQIMSLLVPAGACPTPMTPDLAPIRGSKPAVLRVRRSRSGCRHCDNGRVGAWRSRGPCRRSPDQWLARHRPIEQCQQLSCGEFPGSERGAEDRHRGRQIRWRVEADVDDEVILADNGESNEGSDSFTVSTVHCLSATARVNASTATATSPTLDVKTSRSSVGRSVSPCAASARPPASRKEPASGMAKKTRHLDLKVGDRTAAHRDPLERTRSTSGCHACLIAAGR
jgi:hypothetical protein